MSLTLITASSQNPFSIEAFQDHVYEDPDTFQLELALGMLKAQVEAIEGAECYVQLMTATLELGLDRFPSCRDIILPLPPLQSVESITYLDSNGDEQTFGTLEGSPESAVEYGVELNKAPKFGRIYLRSGQSWPTALCQPDSVKVRFVAGFGDCADDIPFSLRQWIYIKAGSLYQNREGESVGHGVSEFKYVDALLNRYRARKLVY